MMPWTIAHLLTLLAFASASQAQQAPLPAVELYAGMHRIEAELAATAEARQFGLMLRNQMASHRGMLFVFPERATHCMWMRNTLLPLSVAFVDDEGRIVNIEDMQPRTEDNHCAQRPVRFALEMNQGWFRSRGIGAGYRITGLEKLAPSR
jgi:uncharacterized membrane protein (UPF0127 family)